MSDQNFNDEAVTEELSAKIVEYEDNEKPWSSNYLLSYHLHKTHSGNTNSKSFPLVVPNGTTIRANNIVEGHPQKPLED